MNIETKLNIGEDAYFMHLNSLMKLPVRNIKITVCKDEQITILYTFLLSKTEITLSEYVCFKTTDELFQSLIQSVQ